MMDRVITRRETAALMCAQTVILTILSLFEKDPGARLDVDRLVEAVFHRFESGGTFRDCDISARDLYVMQNLFREEKLYYDFLR